MPKAQSAMEYLMTYGWAILILGIALSVLYSLGLFSPNTFVTSQCIFPADFSCISGILVANGLFYINLEQSTVSNINLTAIGCNNIGNTANMITYSPQKFLLIGSNISLSIQCYNNFTKYNAKPGYIFQGYLVLNYTSLQTGFPHTVIGRLIQKIVSS